MNSNQAGVKEILDRLLALVLQIPVAGRITLTTIPFLAILKESSPTLLSHGVLRPSLCIVLQGRKRLQIGDKTVEYKAGDFLAASIDMPVNGQVVEAAPETPYIALRIELTPGEVAAVAAEADIVPRPEAGSQSGIFVGEPGAEVLEGFEKLLKLSADAKAAKYLAPAVKREIIYRMLAGAEGPLFYKNMLLHQEAAK